MNIGKLFKLKHDTPFLRKGSVVLILNELKNIDTNDMVIVKFLHLNTVHNVRWLTYKKSFPNPEIIDHITETFEEML